MPQTGNFRGAKISFSVPCRPKVKSIAVTFAKKTGNGG